MPFKREIINEINVLKNEFRIITLIGPRQAGKTTLCKLAFPDYRYVSLEDPDTRAFAQEDPRSFLDQYDRFVIFDEIQRVPSLLSYLQTIVDRDQIYAQFILTGSHQLQLSEAVTQSLAGRTALLTLLPLTFSELQSDPQYPEQPLDVNDDMLCGFMPGKHAQQMENTRFYRNYFQTYVERDVRALLEIKQLVKFENFVKLLAGRVGQLINQAALATEVGVSASTIAEWLSVLEASFIIFRLPPYFENFGKRVIKSSKLYFVDTGLAAWLLGIEEKKQLIRDPLRGNLFENMVVVEILKRRLNKGLDPRLYFYRDSHGREVDLVIQQGRQLLPIEIKSSQTPQKTFSQGIRYFQQVVGDRSERGWVVFAGNSERVLEHYGYCHYRNATHF